MAIYEKRHEPIFTVAVVGPVDLVNKTLCLANRFPNLKLQGCPYAEEAEVANLVRTQHRQVDMILFTGQVAYQRAAMEVTSDTPMLYVPYTISWLYPSLFRLKEKADLTILTIDSFPRTVIEEAYSALGLDSDNIYVQEEQTLGGKDIILNFHRDHYLRGLSSGAITCWRSIYKELVNLGIPCDLSLPTEGPIIETLEKAFLIGESVRNKESQVVVGLIEINNSSLVTSEYDPQRLQLEIYATILDYVKETDGYLITTGLNNFLFFTTRGLFERSTNWGTSMPLLNLIKKRFKLTARVGVGFGLTAQQAGTNALIALNKTRENGDSCCYVLMEDKSILGPLGCAKPVHYELATTDKKVLEQAEAAGISSISLKRVIACMASLGKETFSANDLAPLLGVSLRSTHRFLNQLAGIGYVQVVGEEKLTTKGRPRQLYKLLL
ncbi:GTP cyclohydrolase III [Moorella thermoacetica]|uniref:GTP cyclohydrolase III n=1 Tax=Neomoorella thermoacetica TaxID=1525 RepID=A0A1J5NS57_NEOTH|nr:GTP cyclohydrolase III [Moorella thermoacetica]